jgi:hypothetical protein
MSVEMILNIVAQIIFFILNIFMLPWIASRITDKFGDGLPAWIDKPTLIIKSWTVTLLAELIRFPIFFLTFNKPEDLQIGIVEGELEIDYDFNSSRYYWWNPIMQVGKYLANVVWILMGPTLTILLLWLIMPATFSGVVSGLEPWVALQSGVTDITYFREMWKVFCDIIWQRLIISGLEENVVLLAIFLVVMIFFSDYFVILYKEDEDYEGPADSFFSFPVVALIIVIFNLVFSLVNHTAYLAVSYHINAVGMILLLIMIVRVAASIILLCSKAILNIAWKIFTR